MARAEYLLTEARTSIKARLVLWSNGGADDTFISEASSTSDHSSNSGQDSDDNDLEPDPFNHRLLKIDCNAENLAKLYPRCTWAEEYLKSLEHEDSNMQFTPAIHIESNNVSGIKFGSKTSPRAKIATEISRNRGGN